MADLARIKRNVARMAAQNAPEEDIDGYIASEGVTIDDVKNYQSNTDALTGAVSSWAHGASLGLADKVGGAINGIGRVLASPITGESVKDAYNKGYDEIVGDSQKQREKFANNHPVAAFGLEVGGNIGGAGKAIYNQLANKGLKGVKLLSGSAGVEGAVQNAADSEKIEDIPVNAITGGAVSAAVAPIIPGAVKGAKWLKDIVRPETGAEKRAINRILENVSKSDLERMGWEADRFSSNLLATGDDKIISLAQAARQQSPEAASLIENRLRDLAETRPADTRRRMAISLGNNYKITGKYQNIDDLVEMAKSNAKPLYEKLRKIGDLDAYALGKKGSKELGGRLKTQKFSNIEFGRMRPDKLAQLNDIRAQNGLDPLTPDMKIPLNVVEKLYNKRVITGKMKPEQVADMVFDVFYNPESVVDASKFPHIQAMISPKQPTSNIGFIGQNPANGETVIKSAYPENTDRLKDTFKKLSDILDGHAHSSSVRSKSPVAAARISALQDIANANNISPLGQYVKDNDFIQEAISMVRKDKSLPRDVRLSSDTDFTILDEAQRKISDMIEKAKRNGENNKMMRLTLQKSELLKQMDKIAPEYKEARKYYEAKSNALRAQAIGEDVFKPEVSPELLSRSLKDMDWMEKRSLKIGATAELQRKLGQANNEAVALGRMLNDNTLQKMELVYGKPSAKNFRDYIESEVKRNRNTNRILSGSQTSEKQSLRDKANLSLRLLKNPTGAIGELLGAGENRVNNATNKAIAEILTNGDIRSLIKVLSKNKTSSINKNIADLLLRGNIATALQMQE